MGEPSRSLKIKPLVNLQLQSFFFFFFSFCFVLDSDPVQFEMVCIDT